MRASRNLTKTRGTQKTRNGGLPTSTPRREPIGGGRGFSPVIGVILMVAITVILAAVIGTFVLGLGDSVEQNPQAGVTFNEADTNDDGTNEETTVTVTSMPRAATVTVDGAGCSDVELTSVGGSTTCSGSSGTVTVTATYEGNTAVISQHETSY